jgi:hypothetical protein
LLLLLLPVLLLLMLKGHKSSRNAAKSSADCNS